MHSYRFRNFKHSNVSFHSQSNFFKQGFTKFNYIPLEVLAIIEHMQKHLNRVFSDEEIQSGILQDLLTEDDYDIVNVVNIHFSTRIFTSFYVIHQPTGGPPMSVITHTYLCLRIKCCVCTEGFIAHFNIILRFRWETYYHPYSTLSRTRYYVSELGRNMIHSSCAFEHSFSLSLQKRVLNEEQKRAVADEAKCLYKREPNLFAASDKEYRGTQL